MLVKDIMMRDVVTVSPFATLRDALGLDKLVTAAVERAAVARYQGV